MEEFANNNMVAKTVTKRTHNIGRQFLAILIVATILVLSVMIAKRFVQFQRTQASLRDSGCTAVDPHDGELLTVDGIAVGLVILPIHDRPPLAAQNRVPQHERSQCPV